MSRAKKIIEVFNEGKLFDLRADGESVKVLTSYLPKYDAHLGEKGNVKGFGDHISMVWKSYSVQIDNDPDKFYKEKKTSVQSYKGRTQIKDIDGATIEQLKDPNFLFPKNKI